MKDGITDKKFLKKLRDIMETCSLDSSLSFSNEEVKRLFIILIQDAIDRRGEK